MNLLLVLFALGFGVPSPSLAQQIVPIQYSTTTASLIVEAYAVHYGIQNERFLKTLQCESGLNEKAVGDHGSSFGVAQIHLPAHTDITKEEALDPFFAIDWAAHQFSLGNQRLWSCYKNIYGSEIS